MTPDVFTCHVNRFGAFIFALFSFLLVSSGFSKNSFEDSYFHRTDSDSDFVKIVQLYESDTRKVVSLNGVWEVKSPMDKLKQEVFVPGGYDGSGEFEFSRTFHLDSTFTNMAIELVLFGVNNQCKVFINDNFLISHVGGDVPFSVELRHNKLVLPGDNSIKIVVGNKLSPVYSVPLKHSPELGKNYGGITRDIFLIASPALSISRLRTSYEISDDLSGCQLTVSPIIKLHDFAIDFNAETDQFLLQIELRDSAGEKVIARNKAHPFQFDKKVLKKEIQLELANLELWSPANPVYYKLKVSILKKRRVIDAVTSDIGFKKFGVVNGKPRLNGNPFFFKGIDWYEGYPGFASSPNLQFYEDEIDKMKNLGVNAIHVVGKAPHPLFLELCNKSGILVLAEMPLSFVPFTRFNDPAFAELSANYFREIVEYSSDAVCMAGWSPGTDIEWRTDNNSFLNEVKKRFIDYPSLNFFVGYRHYFPEYVPEFFDMVLVNLSNKNVPSVIKYYNSRIDTNQKSIIFSIGYSITEQLNGEMDDIAQSGSTDYNSLYIDAQEQQAYRLARFLYNSELTGHAGGYFVNSFADWEASFPVLANGANPDKYIMKTGIFSKEREERISRDIVTAFFNENEPRNLSFKETVKVKPNAYPAIGIGLLLIFLYNFNRNRKFRDNLRRVFVYPHGFYTELKENRKVPNAHTFLISISTMGVVAIVLSSILFNYRESALADNLINLFTVNQALKTYIIWLSWNPLFSILSIFVICLLFFCLMILTLKFFSALMGQYLPISQFYALVFWVNACFIWLLPIAPIYYRVINQTDLILPSFGFFGVLIIWFIVRLFRAVKVVFGLTFIRTFALTSVLFLLFFGATLLYFDSRSAILEYLPMYYKTIVQTFHFNL